MALRTGQILGMKEARETLQELGRSVQSSVGKRALKAPAAVFVESIKSKARVSSRSNDPTPGSLRDSVKVGKSSSRGGTAKIEVIADDIAAVPNEYGLTSRRYPAAPFFRPGIDHAREPAAVAMAAAVTTEVDLAAARAAKKAK